MNKKAQIQHAFTFILFIVIAGFLTLIGYKAIGDLFGDRCELERITFQENIEGLFDKYDDYGSVHRENLRLPCDYVEICFVNNSVYQSTGWTSEYASTTNKGQILRTAMTSQNNIFLVGEFVEPIGYSEKILIEDVDGNGDLCVQARGNIAKLVFKGQGQKTLVEEQ